MRRLKRSYLMDLVKCCIDILINALEQMRCQFRRVSFKESQSQSLESLKGGVARPALPSPSIFFLSWTPSLLYDK